MSEPSQPSHLSITNRPALLNRCVLLVDDHPPTQFAAASALTDGGAEVSFASESSEAAFRCAARQEAGRPYDLVIVTLHAPGNLTTCRRLRESGYRGPMLAVGPLDDPRLAADAGADATLPSSTDGDALFEATVELVGPPRINDVTIARDAPPVVSDLAAFPQMHAMLERFVDQLPQQLSAMIDAATVKDLDRLEQLVSDLKRSAGSHGFIDISREAAATERHLHATEQVGDALEQLTDLCRRAAVRHDGDLPLPPSA